MEAANDELSGVTLQSRYRLDELLGEGGMGRVYRGTQLAVNREVAVKVLHRKFARDSTVASRFLREAELVSNFSHPNIVTLLDYGTDPEHSVVYLVMELVEGLDLGTLLETSRIRPELAVEILDQSCAALTEPHRQEIVHRDLKPDNLMVKTVSDGSLQTKILDFGIARVVQTQTQLTQTDTPFGTPSYMSPEQVRSRDVGPETDLYALGVILFELLSGRRPFSGGTGFEIMLGHVQRTPPSLEDLNDAVPGCVAELIATMLEKDPEDRPESADAVRQRLDEIRRRAGYDRIRIDPEAPLEEVLEPWLETNDGDWEETVSTQPRDHESLESVRERLRSKLDGFQETVVGAGAAVEVNSDAGGATRAGPSLPATRPAEMAAGAGAGVESEDPAETPQATEPDVGPTDGGYSRRALSAVAVGLVLLCGISIGLILSVGSWAGADAPSSRQGQTGNDTQRGSSGPGTSSEGGTAAESDGERRRLEFESTIRHWKESVQESGAPKHGGVPSRAERSVDKGAGARDEPRSGSGAEAAGSGSTETQSASERRGPQGEVADEGSTDEAADRTGEAEPSAEGGSRSSGEPVPVAPAPEASGEEGTPAAEPSASDDEPDDLHVLPMEP